MRSADAGEVSIMKKKIAHQGAGTASGSDFPISERYLTKGEVAGLMSVSLRTVDNLMRRGWLVYHKIGRTVRFRKDDIDQHLNATASW